MQRLILLLLLISSCLIAFGQNVENITKWTVKVSPADIRSGESGQLILTGTTVKGWHIYSTKEVLKGPYPTTFTVTGQGIETRKLIVAGSEVSEVIEPTPLKKFDPNFNLDVGYFEGEVSFKVPFTLKAGTKGKVEVGVKVLAQACNESGCQRPYGPDLTATIAVSPGEPRSDRLATAEVQKAPRNDQATQFNAAKNDGLLSFFFFAFISGLGALITPCVFPMIPVTVSFFTKKAGGSLKEQLKGAALYCAGIIGTFTVLGLGITSLFGAANLNRLATNLWVNLFLGLLFIALSFSLFGVFELALPSSVLTKMDSLGRKGGALAPIFMGTTFSLTTFTCTVAFVGTLLASAASLGPAYAIAGMVGFSTAFALPFFFFAMFPGLLHKLPKSGSWLSTAKAYLGFIELMAALKFLSSAEIALNLGILTRPVFLAIWATLAIIAALYLLGWLVLSHDREPVKIGWFRRGFAIATLAMGGAFLGAINGLGLGDLNAFMPPDPYPSSSLAAESVDGLTWQQDLSKAAEQAQKEGKLLFVDFTGVFCTNCRAMEKNMFPIPAVQAEMSKFVTVKLYCDRPGNKQDDINAKLKEELTKSTELPSYVIMKADGKTALRITGFTKDRDGFLKFLKDE